MTTQPISGRLLAVLILAVVLAHLGVLQGGVGALNDATMPEPSRSFITRSIETAPQNPSQTQTEKPATRAATQPRRVMPATQPGQRPQVTPATANFEQNEAKAPVPQKEFASNNIAIESPASAPAPAPAPLAFATPPDPQQGTESVAAAAAPAPARAVEGPEPPALVAESVRLMYDVRVETRGVTNHATAELNWRHDAGTYTAQLVIRHWLLGSRGQTSQGQIMAGGLAPNRFTDKVRSEVAAHFERDKGRITFSANTPEAPLLPGAQDRLSVFLQLGALLAAEPSRYPGGSTITLPVAGPRAADTWTLTVGSEEPLDLPGGVLSAVRLVRNPQKDYDQKLELWLAPALAYLPVRIRLTEASGDVADQQWRESQKP